MPEACKIIFRPAKIQRLVCQDIYRRTRLRSTPLINKSLKYQIWIFFTYQLGHLKQKGMQKIM
jgi:hypothetical protein